MNEIPHAFHCLHSGEALWFTTSPSQVSCNTPHPCSPSVASVKKTTCYSRFLSCFFFKSHILALTHMLLCGCGKIKKSGECLNWSVRLAVYVLETTGMFFHASRLFSLFTTSEVLMVAHHEPLLTAWAGREEPPSALWLLVFWANSHRSPSRDAAPPDCLETQLPVPWR